MILGSHSDGNEELCLLGYDANKQNSLHAGFLLGILFSPEDGDDIFLRNIG
jgi:hypothetical protein